MLHISYESEEGFLCEIVGIFPAAGLIAAEIIDVVVVSAGDLIQIFCLPVLNPADQFSVFQNKSPFASVKRLTINITSFVVKRGQNNLKFFGKFFF